MRDFQLRSDLTRAVINGFALPLGIEPADIEPPTQGYTVTYTPGEEDEPDTYAFHAVISHERLADLVRRAFDLLPEEVFPIVEIGSRDAYRAVDVYLGAEPSSRDEFLEVWQRYETLLLEDATIGAGANQEDPFIEIFLDQWKGLSIHVPLAMRDEVESLLDEFDLEEVAQTWSPESEDEPAIGGPASQIRNVLDLSDEYAPDIDELLLLLRHDWRLELNIDPDSNVDDSGRRLGLTLWHAVAIVHAVGGRDEDGAYASVWATAGSMTDMQRLIEAAIAQQPGWRMVEVYTIDRVAYDERPDELADLTPRRDRPRVHHVQIDPWGPASDQPPEAPPRRQAPRA